MPWLSERLLVCQEGLTNSDRYCTAHSDLCTNVNGNCGLLDPVSRAVHVYMGYFKVLFEELAEDTVCASLVRVRIKTLNLAYAKKWQWRRVKNGVTCSFGLRTRDSSVNMTISYGLKDRSLMYGKSRNFSLQHQIKASPGARTVCCPVGLGT